MNRLKQLGMGLMMLSLAGLMSACASVKPEVRAVVRDAGAKTGDTVHLYYAKSKTALQEFCPDAVVPVYRMGTVGYYLSKTEVGKLKVTKELGEHYIEAVVVEGNLRAGDIAMQPNSECLLQMPEAPPIE